jgi:hypothetical protein
MGVIKIPKRARLKEAGKKKKNKFIQSNFLFLVLLIAILLTFPIIMILPTFGITLDFVSFYLLYLLIFLVNCLISYLIVTFISRISS